MTENSYAIPGLEEFSVKPTPAYTGYAGRVHATPEKALDDEVSNRLAAEWPRKAGDGVSGLTFKGLVESMTESPDFYERALRFARWRKANGF